MWELYWSFRMKMAREEFAKRLAEAPLVPFKPRSRRDLATLCGVGVTTYRGWEAGSRQLPKAVHRFVRWAVAENDCVLRAAIRRAKRVRAGKASAQLEVSRPA
jgi:hypothetical protein